MTASSPTIAAIATPAGRGGIGVIRLSGSQAFEIAQQLSGRDSFTPRLAQLATWKDAAGETIDAGLMIHFPNPASYTGEDVVELQGHGSPVLLNALLKRCLALGAKLAEPGEFTRRAVEHGCMNLSQAEAVIACIDAATERAAKQAQKHLSGTFGRRIEHLMHQLTGIVAHVEATLDFPEDEIPELFLEQVQNKLQEKVLVPIQNLLKSSAFGERLFSGATVAIIGAPNVGKSSLLNALSGRERAIVSDTAGTTRDTLEIDFEVHGIPIRLIDTAGMRETDNHIEQEGVRRAQAAADTADMVILLEDATQRKTWGKHLHYDLKVRNKADLLSADEKRQQQNDALLISALSGVGISELLQIMAKNLGDMDVAGEDLFVTSARHRQAIEQAERCIHDAIPMLLCEEQLDLAALSLRQAWGSLGEILGIGDVEHILDRVFSEFCVGK